MDRLFEKRMRELLGDQADEWKHTLEMPRYQGVRIDGSKEDPKKIISRISWLEDKSPFAPDSYYIHGQHGLDPAHLQGLIYFQEPSASAAIQELDLQNSDLVLDLCAAPGSKSTQIAQKLDEGFLMANEYDSKRALILASNLERMGVSNCMTVNMDAKDLCRQLPQMFDKILVDAPCSGEGMMKKHEAASLQWSIDNVLLCSARQKDILKSAWKALKPGGTLVYSTCTYAPEENEQNVAWLLKNFEDAVQLDLIHPGRKGIDLDGMDPSKVRRIYPMDQGEGHFIARIGKADNQKAEPVRLKTLKNEKPDQPLAEFMKEQLDQPFSFLHSIKDKDDTLWFGMNHPFIDAKKARVIAQGVFLGKTRKGRFEPAHAFFMSSHYAKHGLQKTQTSLEQMDDFYHGMQLNLEAPKGWRALCYQGIPYGFGKSDGKRITNKLPKGLRLNPNSHIAGSQKADGEDLQ